MQNTIRSGIVILLAAASLTAADRSPEQPARVRTTEPTVVNVHDRVEETEQKRERCTSRALKRAAGGATFGAGRVTGWLLNAGDDIPSPYEREEAKTRRQR